MVKHQPEDVRINQLFMAGMQVVAEKGYHNARIDDIVSRAGLSKGSFYHHFRNKDDFFLRMFEGLLEEFKAQMIELIEKSATAHEAISGIIESFGAWVRENPQLFHGMSDFYLLAAHSEDYQKAFTRYYEDMVNVMAKIIQRGIDRGEFSAELDARRMAWALATCGDGLILLHMILGQQELGIQTMKDVTELMLCGAEAQQKTARQPKGQRRSKETK